MTRAIKQSRKIITEQFKKYIKKTSSIRTIKILWNFKGVQEACFENGD